MKQSSVLSRPHSLWLFLSLFFVGIAMVSCEEQKDDMEDRDAIVGSWDVVENPAGVITASVEIRQIQEAYIVNITRSDIFADEVYIYNFFAIGSTFHLPAFVDGKTITISEITLEDFTFRGQGTIASNNRTIEWSYWVTPPGGSEEEYRATYTFRQ